MTFSEWLKSNLNLPGATYDPAWATWSPRIFLKDEWTICADVWLLDTELLNVSFTLDSIFSPDWISISSSITKPVAPELDWMTSATLYSLSSNTIEPWSDIWPPAS